MAALDSLNENQQHAVEAGDGPVLIVAGPGTGKTKTLTSRIVWLLERGRAIPSEIVALTFTNKAAREMRERVELQLSHRSRVPKITTFHSLGAEILKTHGSENKLIDEQQRSEIIRALPKSAELKGLSLREQCLLISRIKSSEFDGSNVPSFSRMRESRFKPVAIGDSISTQIQKQVQDDEVRLAVGKLLQQYENKLANLGLYDFDDLLVKSYQLLKTEEGKRPCYKYVLVDEFQDTSELQYELLKLISDGNNIFVIGDPNQSIYSFRGADAEMFTHFQVDFPNATEIDLTVNYRSRPEIVNLANEIFPDAPQLEAYNEGVSSVKTIQTLNEYSEAAYILGEIERGIGGSDMLKANCNTNVKEPREFAVLYRTHRVATAVQRAFAEAGIPYQIAGEGSPYEHPDIEKVLAVIRALHSPTPDNKAELVKYLKLGNLNDSQIKALLVKYQEKENVTVCNLAIGIAEYLGLERAIQFEQFLGSLVQYGTCQKGLQLFLDNFDSLAESEFYDPNINAVTLLTIHVAKGLEFSHVFLVGAEEGVLPKITASQNVDIDEERRMFYVAVTRAKENLEILHTKFRAGKSADLSRFVVEIPNSLIPRTADPNMESLERRAKKRRQKSAQSSLF